MVPYLWWLVFFSFFFSLNLWKPALLILRWYLLLFSSSSFNFKNDCCLGFERDASDSRVLQIERRLEEVARQANSAHVQVQEVELQLQASLASTYNGGFLWRIPEISRRRRDAVEERVVSLYSPPFYTAR